MSDELQNDPFGDYLKRRFDAFDPPPRPELWDQIRDAVPTARRVVRRTVRRALLLLVALLGISLPLQDQIMYRSSLVSKVETNIAHSPMSNSVSNAGVLQAKLSLKPGSKEQTQIQRLPSSSIESTQQQVLTSSKAAKTLKAIDYREKQFRFEHKKYQVSEVTQSQDRLPAKSPQPPLTTQVEQLTNQPSLNQSTGISLVDKPQKYSQLSFSQLTPNPLVPLSVDFHLPSLESSGIRKAISSRSVRKPLCIAIGISPLLTFQRITIPRQPEIRLQNVTTPRPLEAQTTGIRIDAGLSQHDWLLQLNATQLKRWAYYEVATDQFRVQPIDATHALIIREGIPVIDEKNLVILGLSLQKRIWLWERSKIGWFAQAGADINYSTTETKPFVGLIGSVGLCWRLSPKYTLLASPMLQYSLTDWSDHYNRLRIRPYQVGLSLGWAFSLKP